MFSRSFILTGDIAATMIEYDWLSRSTPRRDNVGARRRRLSSVALKSISILRKMLVIKVSIAKKKKETKRKKKNSLRPIPDKSSLR